MRSPAKPNLNDLTDVANSNSCVTTSLSTTHLDRQLIEELPLSSWQRMFGAFGRPTSLPARVDHDEISKILLSTVASVPTRLADALDAFADLGHDDGREALLAAAEARAIDTHKWKDDESPSELAARVLCESERDSRLRECVLHARVLVWDKAGTKRFYQFAGREPKRVSKPASKAKEIKESVSEWCSNNGRGSYTDVLILDDGEDNELRLEIFHAHRQQAPLLVEGNKRIRKPQRLAHCDSLRYDPTLGRLRIAARSVAMIGECQGCCRVSHAAA